MFEDIIYTLHIMLNIITIFYIYKEFKKRYNNNITIKNRLNYNINKKWKSAFL